jgi:hypothetical protein
MSIWPREKVLKTVEVESFHTLSPLAEPCFYSNIDGNPVNMNPGSLTHGSRVSSKPKQNWHALADEDLCHHGQKKDIFLFGCKSPHLMRLGHANGGY